MKPKKTNLSQDVRDPSEHLFEALRLLLEYDLTDPEVEEEARDTLRELREKGYSFPDFDLQDCDCLACLYMVMMCAVDLGGAATIESRSEVLH